MIRVLACLFAVSSLAFAPTADAQPDERTNSATELLQEGGRAYSAKKYASSADAYERAVAAGADQPNVPFNAACASALSGDPDRAFRNLEVAIDLGYIAVDHLEVDSDLKSLHDDPRWSGIVSSTRAAATGLERQWKSPAWDTPFQENLPDEEKVAGLSKLWAEVKFNFVNFHLVPDIDWDADYIAAIPRVLDTQSTAEYYHVLEKLMARLQDGHTNVYPPSELRDQVFARPGFRTRMIGDKVIVVDVFDQTLGAEGIHVGMELLAIDGQPVTEYGDEHVRPFMCASTPQDLTTRTFEYFLLRGDVASPVKLSFRDLDGHTIDRTLNRLSWEQRSALNQSSTPPFEFEMVGNIAHIKLNSFDSNEAAEAFNANFDAISSAGGVVLDLRNNGGGNSGVGWAILRHFTDQPFRTTTWHTLQYRPAHRAWNRRPQSKFGDDNGEFTAETVGTFDGPVVMLIGPRTFSAAEDMAAAFDMLDRGALIGEATGGSTGQPLSFQLPGGGSARVCTKHDLYADGTEFVGVGIQPDVPVAQSVADFRGGIDTVFAAAVAHLGVGRDD